MCKMKSLHEMANIGKVTESKLLEVGIESPQKLIDIGSKEVFLRIRMNDSSACIRMLYGLEGAIQGVLDNKLPDETKNGLKEFYNSL